MTEFECREALAAMMIRQSIATGHGDTFNDLLAELEAWIIQECIVRNQLAERQQDLDNPIGATTR